MKAITNLRRLEELIGRFPARKVVVLGDVAADEYVVGRPARISREAPVLILEYTSSFLCPGGATNAAYNFARLGATTCVVGTVGDDAVGKNLCDVLSRDGVAVHGLIVDPTRPTATKTRIVAKGTQEVQQQIVRVDRVDSSEMDAEIRDRMINEAWAAMRGADALLISDYESGVISQTVIDECLPEARRLGLTIVVDSHGDLFRFRGVTAATPNQPEASGTVGRPLRSESDVDAAGSQVLEGMDARAVLITRGSEGVALYERDREPLKLAAAMSSEHNVVDPNGAGDTVAAVFTLAIASGGSFRDGAMLGNLAGGEVVRKFGAATLSSAELCQALRGSMRRAESSMRDPTIDD